MKEGSAGVLLLVVALLVALPGCDAGWLWGEDESPALVAEHPFSYAEGLMQGWASPKVKKTDLAFGKKLHHLVPTKDFRFASFDALAKQLGDEPGSDPWIVTNPTITRIEGGYVALAKLTDWSLCEWNMRGPPIKFSPDAKRKGQVSSRLAVQLFDDELKARSAAVLANADQDTNEKYGCNDPLLRDGFEDPKVVVLADQTAWVMLTLAGRGQKGKCKFHLAFTPLVTDPSAPTMPFAPMVELKFNEALHSKILPPFVASGQGYQK
jgi:hypothetical protein